MEATNQQVLHVTRPGFAEPPAEELELNHLTLRHEKLAWQASQHPLSTYYVLCVGTTVQWGQQ